MRKRLPANQYHTIQPTAPDPRLIEASHLLNQTKQAILIASAISAVAGFAVIYFSK